MVPLVTPASTPDATPPPNQVELSGASELPKGQKLFGSKSLSLGVIVLIPLLLPTLALLGARGEVGYLDLSFGLIAVAAASLTRATSSTSTEWQTVGVLSFACSVVLMGIGIATDHFRQSSDLLAQIGRGDVGYIQSHAGELHSLALQLVQAQPTFFPQWFLMIALGALIVTGPVALVLWDVP